MSQEFDCIECGRHIVRLIDDQPCAAKLCGHCFYIPGWFRHDDVRKLLAPEGLNNLPAHEKGGPTMDKTEWRKARAEAFTAGAYKMRVPDPTTGNWDIVSWCNWVEFHDPSLNGFDDRTTSTTDGSKT
jgi:hypothetical protein